MTATGAVVTVAQYSWGGATDHRVSVPNHSAVHITDISSAPSDYEYREIANGMYWTRPKSRAGWRIIPLVDPLRTILETHTSKTAGKNTSNDARPHYPCSTSNTNSFYGASTHSSVENGRTYSASTSSPVQNFGC